MSTTTAPNFEFPSSESPSINPDFVFPSRIPVVSTSSSPDGDDDYILDIINPRDNFIFDEDIQSIKSSEDLVFAVDTFSNLVGHYEDDEEYDEDIIEEN